MAPSTYWMVNEKNMIYGVSRLRHTLTKKLELVGGHIGYDVPPSLRRNGYRTILLSLTLGKAKSMGIEKVLVTCDKDNIASVKVIINNGGKLDNEIIDETTGNLHQRYWIELS